MVEPLARFSPGTLTRGQVHSWAASGESETLEFKQTTGERREACRSICAMLNHRGGRVLFGVTPTRDVIGQQVSDHTLEEVSNELREIEPPIFPSIERIVVTEDREVLVITVANGQNGPYTYRGYAYKRVGNTSPRMSRDEYNRMLLERLHGEIRWENEAALAASIDDLDLAELVRTVDEAVRRGRAEDPGTRDPLELLRGLGLVREDRILRAALVLFGKSERLEAEYPQCLLRAAASGARIAPSS